MKEETTARIAISAKIENWPKVAIIVLNYNGWQDTIECLESLQQINYPNYQIIVVDNGSTDGSIRYLRLKYPDLTLIVNRENLGYAGGNNVGICYALEQGADYVLILNNDTTVEPRTVTALVEVAKETKASIVGALIKDASGEKPVFVRSMYPQMLFYSESQMEVPEKKWWPSDRVEGSAMLVCRDFLLERQQTLGYVLDESLFLYCEEIELALWCRQTGKKSVVASDAVVYHKVGASSSDTQGKVNQFYYLTRNRLLVTRKYLRGFSKVCFFMFYPIWRVIRAGMYVTKGQYKIARAIIQGLIDGYKGITGCRKC